jgi:DNA-binding SARP family transcriptional activator
MQVDITLLGGFEVRVGGKAVEPLAWERRQASTLVKLLALTPSRRLHREQCIDAIWPDLDIADAAPRLHKAAHYARKALGDRDAIVLRGDAVALFPSAEVTVDVDEFEQLATRALDVNDREAVEPALERYGGVLLPADPYEEWTVARREHARRRHMELLRRARRWEALLVEDAADEEAHLALMRASLEAGDRRAALRQYERMDRALRDELGMTPSAAATRLRDEIVAAMHEPVVASPSAAGLVGREREMGVLDGLLAEASEERGRAVLVSGPPGVGKSTLVEWLRTRAADMGWRCGTGTAAAIEGAWPYAPVLEAIADLGRRHPTLLDGLDDRYRAEIDRARRGGDIDRYEGADDSGRGVGRPAGHQRLFVAVADLVRLAASGAGVLLIIEDAHEADDASLRLLHYLARVATDERLLLVVTRRSNVEAPPLEDMRASLQRRATLLELEVPPLDLEGTRQLVHRDRVDAGEELVERIWAVSGGIPFAIAESAQRGDAGLDASLVGGIDERTRDVLQRVAIAGMVFDTDEFVALSGLDDEDAFGCLDAALSGRVIERSESGYRFRHALVRDALLADLPPHRQRMVHRDAAKRLEAIGASPARIGHHLLAAGDPAAVPALLRAAETEAALGAYRDALALVDAARPHANHHDMAALSALRGDLLFALGDPAALSAYRDAYELTQPADAKRLVQAKLARVALFSGDLELAGATLRGLELNGDMADSTIIVAKAHHAYFAGDLETATTLANRARELADADSANWQMLDLVALQGLIAHNQGEWFDQLRLELRRTRGTPRLANAVFDGHLCVAEYLLYGPVPYAEVLDLAAELRATGARAGALRAVAFAAALAGEAALLAGDLERAERELQEAVDLHREIGAAAGEAHSLQRFAELELARGNRSAARELLERALPLARWSSIALHLLQRIYGTMIIAAPTPEDARAVVDVAGAALGSDDFCPFCQIMYEVPATIACADAGDLDAAHDHYAIAEQSARLWHGTAWQGGMLEARAHIAAASGDGALAADLFEQAATAFEQARQPLDAARCRTAVALSST